MDSLRVASRRISHWNQENVVHFVSNRNKERNSQRIRIIPRNSVSVNPPAKRAVNNPRRGRGDYLREKRITRG